MMEGGNKDEVVYDYIVVGGGLSGLRCLDLLVDKNRADSEGKKFLLIEARDRVGGRTCSQEYRGYNWDVGGQWVGPSQKRVLSLIKQIGLKTFPQQQIGRKVLEYQGTYDRYTGTVPRVNIIGSLDCQITIWRLEYLCSQIDPIAPWHHQKAVEWDSMTVQEWIDKNVRTNFAKHILKVSILSVFSADPSSLSVLYVLYYFKSAGGVMKTINVKDGAQQDRILGGSHQLSKYLYEKHKSMVQLSSPVSSVNDSDDLVRITCESGSIHYCKKLIMTIPLPLLKSVSFKPELSATKRGIINEMHMGQVIKFIMFYDHCFWRDAGFAGEIVSDRPSVTLIYDGSFEDGSKASLIGFFEGDYATEWAKRTEEERKKEVMDLLYNAFDKNEHVFKPSNYIEKIWINEKYTQGGYGGYCNKYILSKYGHSIRETHGNIHFAGTESAIEWAGYMEGALESSERVFAECTSPGIDYNTIRLANNVKLTNALKNSIDQSRLVNNQLLIFSIFIILASIFIYLFK